MNTLWGKSALSAIDGFCSPGIKTVILIADVIQVGEIEGRVAARIVLTSLQRRASRAVVTDPPSPAIVSHDSVLSAMFSIRWLLTPHLCRNPVIFHTDGVLHCIRMSAAAPLWLVISFAVLQENNCNNNMHLKRIWVSLCELSAGWAACWSWMQYGSNKLCFDSVAWWRYTVTAERARKLLMYGAI